MEDWPDQDEILTGLRDWLDRTRSECESLDERSAGELPTVEPVGLYQLVEQLTALRHDVKILAKAARGSEECGEATRLALQAAIEEFRNVELNERDVGDKAARPFVEAVVDLDESLVRCRRVIKQAKTRVLAELQADIRRMQVRLDELYNTQPWWRRRMCRPWHEAARDLYPESALNTSAAIFDSLLEGYDLVEKRLDRFMQEQSIVRMECLGEPADPSRMSVLEVVSDPSRESGTVIEEVRPGYCWKGRVLRFAEVKAVGEQ